MKQTRPADYRLSDILAEGFAGIGCVEAGGPRPGVGCAGRGIISTFELLDSFHLRGRSDITLYDVLGDVVCGGFAVPIRREYADTILIVTSGEFMALYAAINILRGIRNYDGDRPRVAGLVFNRRNVEGEEERVRRFAGAVGLPVFADVPRSDVFAVSEEYKITPMEWETLLDKAPEENGRPSASGSSGRFPAPPADSAQIAELHAVCGVFRNMAAQLEESPLFTASPLSDDDLEEVILGTEKAGQRPDAGISGADPLAVIPSAADAAADPEGPPAGDPDDLPHPGSTKYLSKNI